MVNIQPQTAYNSYKKLQQAIKALPKSPSANEYKKIKELAEITKKLAQNEVEQKINNSRINKNVDKFLTIIFEKFAAFFNKVGGHNSEDYGKTIVKGVLFGNILKDLMTGIVSTSQSFTNPDYSKDKKLFMGSYDIMACLTTVILSLILGPFALNKINNGYRHLLKPLETTPKYNLVLNGLSAFTTIVLQSIIAKRVFAPAISTPLAGVMKNKLEQRESKINTKT